MEKSRLRAAILNAASRNATLVIKNANIVNVFTEEIALGDVAIRDGLIIGVGSYTGKVEIDAKGAYLTPGLIDGHVHIESSMAHPSRFASTILEKGTTAIIADPHEIANVCGTDGIQYMLDQTEWLALSVFFMIPSCVPCTSFETSGAKITANDMEEFLEHPRVLGLGEVMDYVSTISGDGEMLDKLQLFRESRPIDGHAPRLTGDALNAYCVAGPHTDHECTTYEEVLEKLRAGVRVHLRLGSASREIEGIFRKIAENDLPTRRMMFCTDDKHLEDIRSEGHINYILRRAVANGISPMHAIQMATLNAANTYGLRGYGAVAPGYRADLVLFDNLTDFNPQLVITNGSIVTPENDVRLKPDPKIYNSVHLAPRKPDSLRLAVSGKTPVIGMLPTEITTKLCIEEVPSEDGEFVARDGYLKVAVLERHHASGRIGLGVLKGLHVENGAIATTVGHDSHNLVVVGDNDSDMFLAIDALEECGGGYAVVSGGKLLARLPLPVAGLMSDAPLDKILKGQQDMLAAARTLGIAEGSDPFIRLSFVALPVIPEVRITDMGMFDVTRMQFFDQD